MESVIEHIVAFITAQGAIGVFLASILEEVIVPIPSTVVQTGAGFFFLAGHAIDAQAIWILLSRVAVPAALGATIGSLAIYGLVYWGGMPLVERYGRYFFINAKSVERAHGAVVRYRSLRWAFCLLRFVPILPSVFIAAAAGFIRLPLPIYLWTTFVGMLIRATYLGIAGWAAGEAYQASAPAGSVFGMFLWLALGILAVSGIVGAIVIYAGKKRHH